MLIKPQAVFYSLALLLLLTSCTSFGKGIVQGLLMNDEEKDTRKCEIWSAGFDGIGDSINDASGDTKVIMVHGVGNQIPGYSTQLRENIAKDLGLNVQSRNYKKISLIHPLDSSKELGELRVYRLSNESENKAMLFYELTWSSITADEKAILDYDTSGSNSFRRAPLNRILKKFSNSTIPDPLVYLGPSHKDILMSTRQTICWAMSSDWDELPANYKGSCTTDKLDKFKDNIANDDYIIISHSLGSRIVVDALQDILNDLEKIDDSLLELAKEMQISIFMLSNQLPLLQLGRTMPEISGMKNQYCKHGASHYKDRFFKETSIIAFSDPNDLLSYSLPPGFDDKYLDSRICTTVSNVSINVAKLIKIPVLGELANPMSAHVDYKKDKRVISLLTNGIGEENGASPLINKRCTWTKLID